MVKRSYEELVGIIAGCAEEIRDAARHLGKMELDEHGKTCLGRILFHAEWIDSLLGEMKPEDRK